MSQPRGLGSSCRAEPRTGSPGLWSAKGTAGWSRTALGTPGAGRRADTCPSPRGSPHLPRSFSFPEPGPSSCRRCPEARPGAPPTPQQQAERWAGQGEDGAGQGRVSCDRGDRRATSSFHKRETGDGGESELPEVGWRSQQLSKGPPAWRREARPQAFGLPSGFLGCLDRKGRGENAVSSWGPRRAFRGDLDGGQRPFGRSGERTFSRGCDVAAGRRDPGVQGSLVLGKQSYSRDIGTAPGASGRRGRVPSFSVRATWEVCRPGLPQDTDLPRGEEGGHRADRKAAARASSGSSSTVPTPSGGGGMPESRAPGQRPAAGAQPSVPP